MQKKKYAIDEERDAASVCCSLGFAERLFHCAHSTGFTSAVQTHTRPTSYIHSSTKQLYFIYMLSSVKQELC